MAEPRQRIATRGPPCDPARQGMAPRRRRRCLAMVLALAAGLASTPALARDSDRSQPAEIEADRAEIDRQEGVAHYRGGAVFTQGTLRVTGERITVHAPAGRLERARAEGERAALRQETNAGRLVRARAQRIDYASEAQQITLIGHAEVVRAGERFRAHRIEYDTATDRVEAYSGDTDGRVRIRMAPEEAEDESDTGDE